MYKSPKELRNIKSWIDAEKCDDLKVIEYDKSDNSKIKVKKITLKMFIKLRKFMKMIPIFLQMQNRKNLNLGKITMFII